MPVSLVLGRNFIDLVPRGKLVGRGWINLTSNQFQQFELQYEESEVDLFPFNRVSFNLTSLFVTDENPDKAIAHTSKLGDYGFTGEESNDTYIVDSISEDGSWTRHTKITIDFGDFITKIVKIVYKNTYENTESFYREDYEINTKPQSSIPYVSETLNELIYEAKGEEVCNIVESFSKRRYRSENGELFDYIEHRDCDDNSTLTVTFSNQ